jgi:choline-sulfatase
MTKRKPTVGHDGSQPVEHDLQSPASSKGISQAKTRPNVLLLMADQHRRTCIGAAGDSVARTPNLDRLAEQSVRFTNAFCTNPVCAPSRASMLTGLFSHRLDSTGNDQPFAPQHKTVAEYFSRADYLTALIGKMHLVDAQLHGNQTLDLVGGD